MPNLWVIFLTGLTTGGLSCLAVQGGLLANVIAQQAEEEYKPAEEKKKVDPSSMSKHDLINYLEHQNDAPKKVATYRSDMTLAISLFLVAKIAAYTVLGFGLGYLGTAIQLSPIARGVLMLAISVFMIGTALRMLGVHPIFNYFQIQPPKFVRKFIRRISKNSKEDFATPVFLGSLTVLIPCGVTQAMMALALGTGSPAAGALIMFSFTLGASPLFFILAVMATRLGEKLNNYFVKIVAILVIIFALLSLESGLNLVGSPISYNAYKQWLSVPTVSIAETKLPEKTVAPTIDAAPTVEKKVEPPPSEQTLTINATDDGYVPNIFKAKAGIPTKITLITKNTYSCTRAFVIPSLNLQKILPETGSELLTLPAQKRGQLRFSCSMGMYTGQILFE